MAQYCMYIDAIQFLYSCCYKFDSFPSCTSISLTSIVLGVLQVLKEYLETDCDQFVHGFLGMQGRDACMFQFDDDGSSWSGHYVHEYCCETCAPYMED